MTINFNKKIIIIFLAILWFGFSTVYIAHDIWQDFQVEQIGLALEQGRVNTINEIIRQVTGAQCQPIRLFSDQKEINIIDVVCVQQPQ